MTRLWLGLAGAFLFANLSASEAPNWSATLERISSGVISIRVDGTRAFDTEWNQTTQATGFIVDAERGLILTNRHVVMPGPVVAEAVFLNREEVDLKPVYRDPVHDFGFFRFDPEDLKFIKPAELPLAPEGAQVGREIRVVGNDAGEQLSILAGTLARLDRQAPSYGRGQYNDFNTFYYQAASSTSGGSSGSPVIDVNGRVVALNAGGSSGAATSFYLPLDRVQRALRLLQQELPVTRGTLQTVFVHTPFDELRRLGLLSDTEAEARRAFPRQTGMLAVADVVRGGPAEGELQSGDILVRVNGQLLAEFLPLESVLDDSVGETVVLDIQRGGRARTLELEVRDLHEITPDEFLEIGDTVLHRLSYQQARHFNVPPRGIFVANPGYVLSNIAIPRGAVITRVGEHDTRNVQDLLEALADVPTDDRVRLRFFTVDDPKTMQLAVMRMDRKWFPVRHCRRDDTLGYWPCQNLETDQVAAEPEGGSTQFVSNGDPRTRKLAPSLVMVNYDMPFPVSGVSDQHYHGTGVVIDASRGLVVVDRNTVPVAIGDVRFTFAGSLEVPGKVEFIHPIHNLAVVSYDTSLVGDTPVRSADFSKKSVRPGEELWVVGLKGDHKLISQATKVASVDPLRLPLSRSFQFRDSNLETISLVNPPANVDGVLADKRGRVVGTWSSFAYQSGREVGQVVRGIPAELVVELREEVIGDRELRSLEAELHVLPLASARKLGLPESWSRRLETVEPDRRTVLQISRLVQGSDASRQLRSGDLLLAIDGEVVKSFRSVEKAVQTDKVRLTVWREGALQELEVATAALGGEGIDRLVFWAGALLQAPHRAMAAQRGVAPEGVYVAYFAYGSPAARYGLFAGRRILQVDDVPTPDLNAFVAAVAERRHRDSVRLKTYTWNNVLEVITLKLDHYYFPAYQLERTPSGWERLGIGESL
ncbi:MAG: PDZ domain-containing protein [Gammaproteobacteria bacterium]|nr:PDZ domain-containing protein [Gammaproteobacteria bacterium]